MSNNFSLPLYWESHLKEKIARIHELQAQGGKKCVSVGLISDIHWCDNSHESAAIIERVLNECGIRYFFNAGDIVSGCGICSKEFIFDELDSYRRLFQRIEYKCLVAEGNHDRAYSDFTPPDYYVQNLSFNEIYEHLFRPQTQYPDRVFSENGTYYYADDKLHKMRFIVLNSQDVPNDNTYKDGKIIYNSMRYYGFLQTQIDWFASVALDVPDPSWSVVVCSHADLSYRPAWDPKPTCEKSYNQDLMKGIIRAFRKHTSFQGESNLPDPLFNAKVSVDFTNCGGNFIAWLGGHVHYDRIVNLDGIMCMTINNDSLHNSENSPDVHTPYTYKSNAFDVLTICPKEQKVFVTRIGVGEDREFTYETFKNK